MELEQIKQIIEKHFGEQRQELSGYYMNLVHEKLIKEENIGEKMVKLILDAANYVEFAEAESLMRTAINIKIQQIRTYILDHHKDDYTQDKSHFSSISSWMKALILEVNRTFGCIKLEKNRNEKIDLKSLINLKEDKKKKQDEVSNINLNDKIEEKEMSINCKLRAKFIADFQKKLFEELSLIFCSYEKFNSAGNQLLIDLLAYLQNFTVDESIRNTLLTRIKKNFKAGKLLDDEKLVEKLKSILEKNEEKQ